LPWNIANGLRHLEQLFAEYQLAWSNNIMIVFDENEGFAENQIPYSLIETKDVGTSANSARWRIFGD